MDRARTTPSGSAAGSTSATPARICAIPRPPPLDIWREVNTGTNLPAQIDIAATPGDTYEFLFVAKGGGSANKMFLFQETKALLNPASFERWVIEKLPLLGTAACPPYHLAFVIGGTSAESCLKTLKLASTMYLDALPRDGNELGRAFRDLAAEEKVLDLARRTGIGAQFGGKYFALDVRVIRLPRHGASCPVAMGVSCSADRNIKAQDHPAGDLSRAAGDRPGPLHPRRRSAWSRPRASCRSTSTGPWPKSGPSSPSIR